MTRDAPLEIQILTRANGAGLSRDLALVVQLLEKAGCKVTATELSHRSRLSSRLIRLGHWLKRLLRGWLAGEPIAHYDINLMLERIYPEYFEQARHNVLVPNPEWTHNQWRPWLPHFDLIAAKTHHAVRLFESFGCRARWMGFTSIDRMDRAVPRQPGFLHMPGRSNNKGTTRLIQLWTRHPEWPQLTVVWRRRDIPGTVPANVTLLSEYLDDSQARQLQNSHRFHLCPSQTEGYGHYIVEAMSVGAVVVTTDAEPMNELVTNKRGVLVDAHPCGNQALATLHDFDEAAMETAIIDCLAMAPGQCEALGTRARQWFVQNNATFPARLLQVLNDVVTPSADPLVNATASARTGSEIHRTTAPPDPDIQSMPLPREMEREGTRRHP